MTRWDRRIEVWTKVAHILCSCEPLPCVPPHVNLQRLLFSESVISLVTGPGLYSQVGLYVALEVSFGG